MRRRATPIFLVILIAVATATPGIGGPATGTPTETRIAECLGAGEKGKETIGNLRAQGWGYGEIAMAYYLAQQSKKDVEEIVAMRAKGMGWGQIIRALGLPAGELGKAQKALRSCHKQGKGATSTDKQGKKTGVPKGKGAQGSAKQKGH